MGSRREDVERTQKKVREYRKKFFRYDEGAELLSMGLSKFRKLAIDAGAVYKLERLVLVNMDIVDEYMEIFHVPKGVEVDDDDEPEEKEEIFYV